MAGTRRASAWLASWRPAVARLGAGRLPLAAICAFVVAVGAWNVLRYPPGDGYDYLDHKAYADGLIPGWKLPHGVGEYYQPPGFYAIAGSLDWVARKLGVGEPHRAGMGLNVLLMLGTVILVWKLAQGLWPGRTRLAVAACAFVALLPRTVEMEAMFQPEPMALFFCTLALWLGVRVVREQRSAIPLGLALGAAQLVMAAALWTVAAVVVALAAGRRWRELAVVLALAVAIPLPWYVHQQLTYSGLAPFPRPATPAARTGGVETGKAKPIYERRPAAFYDSLGLPDVFLHPYRPHFTNAAIPTTYSELWGDYFAHWSWRYAGTGAVPATAERTQLRIQALVGLLPTLLAVGGWLALLLRSRRSPPVLAIALLPLLGLLGYAFFTISYPTPDGDVLKASYMLTTTAGWAIGFGYALERLRGKALLAVALVLVVSALAELPFLAY